ncbi:hypothetical protein [Parageobacillus thermoglucosidasius]|uniref:DUF1836 domain-containing protein n=1 Tax=Parageobacillus thermoglucosidasius TaxID=1426 RepID=A0AB38R452_PARTM|nr:hypothetical protein [Parageobacillus thermoglucosidasius]UOE78404.1 hypothetical protein IMI45_20110 [Parageobacillus thermoglucosidasius]
MSYLNVYKQELELLAEQPKDWKERLKHAVYKRILRAETLVYTFTVPASYYLRGEMLCEDVSELGEMNYTQQDLIQLLVNDFIRNVRRISDPQHIYQKLLLRDRRPVKINSKRMKPDSGEMSNVVEVEFRIKRSLALRLEVLLADIAELHPDARFSVEDVLEIIYCDFIEAYKNGNLKNVVEKIIENAQG